MAITLTTEVMVAIIAGSVVGGIIVFVIIGAIIYCCCCKSRRKQSKSDKAAPRIESRSNGHANYPHVGIGADHQTPTSDQVDLENEKTVGYVYPHVGGRPVSYPYFGSNIPRANTSPPSSSGGTKGSNPVKRQPSQGLPPNAYRLPGLADKSISMSESNLSTVGTINPAYDPTGDTPGLVARHVYRTQSLVNVDRNDADRRQAPVRSSTIQSNVKSTVYQFDGSLGLVTSRPTEKSGSSMSSNPKDNSKRLTSFDEETAEAVAQERSTAPDVNGNDRVQSQYKIRVARELDAADHVYSVPNKEKKKAKTLEGPPPAKGLPRIPMEGRQAHESPRKKPDRTHSTGGGKRSLTSELSYRAKGHLVTDQAFDFLDGYGDEEAKS